MTASSEATSLFATARTDGLYLRSRDGDRLGQVHAFMIEKRSILVSYAVLSLGGMLGLGRSYYPIPIKFLSYDSTADSYIVKIDQRVLEGCPSWANHTPEFTRAYADRVSSYYEATPETVGLA
ncbi:MAG: PRC-barrel domain-containing protein [Alteraurantiacibacter sp.]